jgi:tetratricopeptide (TPR) repeat protein
MRSIATLLALSLLLSLFTKAYSQNDEQYYYKLGRKYMFTKDYETAAKHYYKCMSIAEKNKNENPNYYYYPMLMYYYGVGKIKQVQKAAALITDLVPASPESPGVIATQQEKYYMEFMNAYNIDVDKSDYIFLRHYIHFADNEMDVVETFDRMEFAVRYHGEKSVIPIQASYHLMKEVCDKAYEEYADPEAGAAPFKMRLCDIFEKAWKAGSNQAKQVVVDNCE